MVFKWLTEDECGAVKSRLLDCVDLFAIAEVASSLRFTSGCRLLDRGDGHVVSRLPVRVDSFAIAEVASS